MRPIDLSKFRKYVTKSIPGISSGFNDPSTFLSTGCFALNYLISNRFQAGIPLEGKMTTFAGDSGSGKSYIAAGNVIRDCQRRDVFPILFDTENALDESWLKALGVNTDENMLYKCTVSTPDDIAETVTVFLDQYKEEHSEQPLADRPRVVFIVDSLGMLVTPGQIRQFEEGDMKGDLGQKAKQLGALFRTSMAKIASENIGIIATNHVYDSQDKYLPDVIAGGKMLEFSSSVIVQMNRLLLREDDEGHKLADGEVAGIRSSIVVRKSRYAKPFERIKVNIPYDTGMDPYSGMFDLCEKKNIIIKSGGSYYSYTSPITKETFKDYRKNYNAAIFDQIMSDWPHLEPRNDVGEGFDLSMDVEN